MLLQPFNVLVMDEPTNHLDIKYKNVLKQACENFEGTLILVSHDRDFLQGLTNKVYEFMNHVIKEYLGDVEFYLQQRKAEDFRAIEKKQEKRVEQKVEKKNTSFQDQKKIKSLKNQLSTVEIKIGTLVKEIKTIDHDLLIDYNTTIAVPDFFDKYQAKKNNLEKLMKNWEELTIQIDRLA